MIVAHRRRYTHFDGGMETNIIIIRVSESQWNGRRRNQLEEGLWRQHRIDGNSKHGLVGLSLMEQRLGDLCCVVEIALLHAMEQLPLSTNV